jgi:hypothetical protein
MGYKKRTYEIEEIMTGNPPKRELVLSRKGNVIDPNVPIIFNKDDDKIKKVDHYRIRFDIKNFSNSRLRFVPNAKDVFWVNQGNTCPTSFCELPGVIWVDEVDPAGEWIDVVNMDMKVEEFRFTLNFVDKSISSPTPADYVPLDPIGGNQNRGERGSGFSFPLAPTLAIGFAAGLAAFFGARLFLAG